MGYILITGGNLKNKGAQSMIFIAVDEMKKRFPEKEIVVVSDPDAAASAEKTSQFRFLFRDSVCLYGWKYKLVQHRYGKLDRTGDAAKIRRQVDMILDISGYTFGSNWGWMANLLAAYRAKRAKRYGVPIYFMPQSFGPFEWKSLPERVTERCMVKWLSYAKVLYAREQEGYELLTGKYGFSNAALSEDMVLQNKGIDLNHIYLQMPELALPEIKENSVAVLPNIRNYKYGNLPELLEAYRLMIDLLLSLGKHVYLIRHATEDLDFCKKIYTMYKNKTDVILLEEDFTCLEYEQLVKRFDYLIASRYHAIVHAYKQGIPCIVLGWAIKYQELLYKFEQTSYAVDVRRAIDKEELSKKIRQMEECHVQESKRILEHLKIVQKKNAFDIMGDDSVSVTVQEGLCTSCGICAAVCPADCIRFEKAKGTYLPEIDREKCLRCGTCLKVCPGYAYDYTGLLPKEEPLCLTARTKDEEILKNATSGGIVTTLVRQLLNNGSYETAFLVNGYEYEAQMETTAVRKGDALATTQRSRYLPVSQQKAVSYILSHPEENIIYVGTGCAVHGLCKALEKEKRSQEHILIIGLFCDRTMNYSIYEYVKQMKPWKSELCCFHFRDKRAGGWPGNMRLEFADGSYEHISAKERMIVKDFCQSPRCLYCYDKLNAQADISVGDNYTGKDAAKDGSSSVILRTTVGRSVWEACQEEFLISSSSYREILRSQHMTEKLQQVRNNMIFAERHDGRCVEQGLPADLQDEAFKDKAFGPGGVSVRRREKKRLQKQLSEIALGEQGAYEQIGRKKKAKRRRMYRKAILARLGRK